VHREYANALLDLALAQTVQEYGPYSIREQRGNSVILRHLQEISSSSKLSVAISMPTEEWLEKATIVPFPIMKGLPSYRYFMALDSTAKKIETYGGFRGIKQFSFGQGRGWSTAKILEDNGFDVVYAGGYDTLFQMLKAKRYDLLMRGIYEIVPEYAQFKTHCPELVILEKAAIYTYLPMYFFVNKSLPDLAQRIELGLHKAHQAGVIDTLFYSYFTDPLKRIEISKNDVLYVENTNIDRSFFERDKPYLLPSIIELENKHRRLK